MTNETRYALMKEMCDKAWEKLIPILNDKKVDGALQTCIMFTIVGRFLTVISKDINTNLNIDIDAKERQKNLLAEQLVTVINERLGVQYELRK